jgi:hypothetical protein
MTARSYADQIDDAADRIADISRADLQIILRRAALRLRNTAHVPLDPEWEEALWSAAAGMNIGRNDLIRKIVEDWLKGDGRLRASTIDQDDEAEAEE